MQVGFSVLAFFCLLSCVIAQVQVLEDDYFERRWMEAFDRARAVRQEQQQEQPQAVKLYLEKLLASVADLQQQHKRGRLRIVGFSYSDCGSAQAPVKIPKLQVTPDPILIPGSINVSVDVNVAKNFDSPLKVELKVEAQVLDIWVTVPCVDNFGSCTFDDACAMLPKSEDDCPPALKSRGIPCGCPFKQGSFSLPSSPFELPKISFPVHLSDNGLRITAHVSQNGAEVGCLHLDLKVTIS